MTSKIEDTSFKNYTHFTVGGGYEKSVRLTFHTFLRFSSYILVCNGEEGSEICSL